MKTYTKPEIVGCPGGLLAIEQTSQLEVNNIQEDKQ